MKDFNEFVNEGKTIKMTPDDVMEFFKDGEIPIGIIFNIRKQRYTRSGYGLTSTYFEVMHKPYPNSKDTGLRQDYAIKQQFGVETDVINGFLILDYLFKNNWYKNEADFENGIFVKDLTNNDINPLKKLYK